MAFFDADFSFGAYGAAYGGKEVGLLEGIVKFQQTAHAQDVRCSRYADSVIDGVYRGANAFITLQIKEWNADTKRIMWPFNTEDLGTSGIIGRSMFDMAKPLVLTAVQGTPAYLKGPRTRTFPRVIFAPEHNIEVIFGAEERNVPILLRVFPVVDNPASAILRWFTDKNT